MEINVDYILNIFAVKPKRSLLQLKITPVVPYKRQEDLILIFKNTFLNFSVDMIPILQKKLLVLFY